MFGDAKLLTEEQVRQLMTAHAGSPGLSGRKAAGVGRTNTTYWSSARSGKQHPGQKIAKMYGLRRVYMYEVVEE